MWCVRWCETRKKSVWALVCLSKQELGGVRSWPRRARTSQRPSAKQQHGRQLTQWLWASLYACSGNLLTSTQTHKQLQMHIKYTFQTTTQCREDMWSSLQSPSPDMIMQECSDGLCKQTCLGGDVRSGPGEWVVPTTAIADERSCYTSTVEIFSPLSAQALLMPTNDQQIQMRADTGEANGGCRKRKWEAVVGNARIVHFRPSVLLQSEVTQPLAQLHRLDGQVGQSYWRN